MKRIITTWQEALKHTESYPALSKDLEVDVCVIGSGIAGITTAYFLAKCGKKVALIEKRTLAESVTAHTTAFITSIIDTNLVDMEKMVGRNGVKQVLASGETAINTIEQIVQKENIGCEFTRVPHYSIAYTYKGFDTFKEDEKLLLSLGYATKILPNSHFPFTNRGSVEMPAQAKFHPMKYLHELRNKAVALGVACFEHTEADYIEGGEIDKDVKIAVRGGHMITAKQVVIATHNPFVQPWWYILKKGTYYSYIMELSIPTGTLPEMIAEDDHNPYNYFRIDKGEISDRMIVGGEDHRKELPLSEGNAFKNLLGYARHILGNTPFTVVRQWRGPILEQTDGLPLIGRYSQKYPNRFVAAGFSGNGMTHGTTAGTLLADLICNVDNQFETLYRPNRAIAATDIWIKGRDYIGELGEGVLRNIMPRKRE
jgi:glycine/D-amino acid oxidase-like deaminating enzyme